ncbi:MAG: hypothetical protein EXR77_05815 [Myxococcales bacterium]|nr:hypothetical protein [Myxococcales bacterium]
MPRKKAVVDVNSSSSPPTTAQPPSLTAEGSAEPLASAPAAESMSERAMRYRQRHLADTGPVARRGPPPPPIAPPRRREEAAADPIGVRRALSMAELAERQRAARTIARQPESGPAPPTRPSSTSMQDRALRFRSVAPDDVPQRPLPTAHIRPQMRPTAADGLARAATATHHNRPTAEPPSPTAPIAVRAAEPPSSGVALVLIARNDAAVLQSRLQAWRTAVPNVDVRLAVLDVGSTDDSVAQAQEDSSVTVVCCAGGLAEPLLALRTLLRATTADVVVVVQAQLAPSERAIAMVKAARAAQPTQWQACAEVAVAIIPAKALRRAGVASATTLEQWARLAQVDPPPRLPQVADWRAGLVVALFGRAPRKRDRALQLIPPQIRSVIQKVFGI